MGHFRETGGELLRLFPQRDDGGVSTTYQTSPEAVAKTLEALLAAIRGGAISASPSTTLRIEGAVVLLRVLSGGTSADIVAALAD